MKATKKIMSVLLAASLGVTALAGCKSKAKDELEAEFGDRTNKVNVVYYSNAYGREWITEVAKAYMENHNSDTFIQLTQTLTPGEEASKIKSGISSGDLYLLDLHVEDLMDSLVEVNDVWDSYAIGEENSENKKKIKDKLSPIFANTADPGNTRKYIMPYQGATAGYGMVYNKTVLDEAFPDGYTLPRTTDEWFAMGDALKEVNLASVDDDKRDDAGRDVYLLVCSFGDGNEYLQYTLAPWFAQIIGYENFAQYSEGRYWNGEAYVFDETKPTVYEEYKDELIAYQDIVRKLQTKSNGYVYADSDAVDYQYAARVVGGKGYRQNQSRAAFKVDGSYFEQESAAHVAKNTEMGMCKLPVASAMIGRLSTVNDDATLCKVIDYVDGVATEKPAGVSDDDILAVAEARGMIGVYLGGGMMIPKAAKNAAGAKDFMRYLASDEAAIIAAKAMGGMELLPYGKTVTEEELGFTRSNFLSDVSKWATMNKTLINGDNFGFCYHADFQIGTTDNTRLKNIFTGAYNKTATEWYQANYNEYKEKWSTMVTDYKKAGGNTAN